MRDFGKKQVGKRVLLVDNDRLFVQLLTELLENEGFKVIPAYDGLEGLEKAREELPDFILVDLIMPKIDGARLCRYLKEDQRLAQTPVVLLSGAVREKMPDLLEVGADAYIAKVPLEGLIAQVRDALAHVHPVRRPGVLNELILGIERTASRATVKELLASEGHNRTILEYIGDGVLKLDASGKVVYANPVALRLVGESEVNAVGRFVWDLLQLDTEPDFKRALQELMRSREATKRIVTVVRAGTILRIVLTNVIEGGEPAGVVVILHDASGQHLAQTEKLRAMGVMAAGMGHDFNNMLGVILGTAELLTSKVKDTWVRKRLEVIRKAALDGAETVRRIQEFSRASSDEAGFVSVDINRVVGDAVEFTKPRWKDQAEEGEVPIRLTMDLQPVGSIVGNPSELREVLVNVLLNAIEAMPQGGDIHVRSQMRDGYVVVTVTDTGCGVTDDAKERVFDPFFTTKGSEGSGLGLSVSYGIITRHKGEITLEGKPGKGTTVEVKLPVTHVAEHDDKAEELQASTKRTRILLIENNAVLLKTLVEVLEMGGHDVTALESGREAVAAFDPDRYDMVLTDLGMPDMSGWEVARAIKAKDSTMPVVLLTGWGASVSEEKAKELGIDIVVSKPFECQQMMSLVDKVLRLREAGGPS